MGLLAISLTAPTGLWESIIFGMEDAVKNYALALILVTVMIKFVMVPFDFINKYTSKKSSRKQIEMRPELDKINQKYGHDKNLLNQKTMEVYKSHNFNAMGTCLGMLIYLVFTMVVFWTLFSSLNGISYYKIGDQYLQVRQEYFAAFGLDVNTLGDETTAYNEYLKVIEGKSEEEVAALTATANANALNKYDETKVSFLWIENIWLPDTTKNPVMDYQSFIDKSKISEGLITESEYNLVLGDIKTNERGNNGYFILAVLAAGVNFLSTFINGAISKRKARKQAVDPSLVSNGSNKLMMIIMPLIMGLFTLFYNAAFGLYIVSGAVITLITSPLVTIFVDMLEIEAIKKEQNKTVAIYDRKRRK